MDWLYNKERQFKNCKWKAVLLERLEVCQLQWYGPRRFITAITRAHQLPQFWTKSILFTTPNQPIPIQFIQERFALIIIIQSTYRHSNLLAYIFSHTCYTPNLSRGPLFAHPNSTCRTVNLKLHIVFLSPAPFYFLFITYDCVPPHSLFRGLGFSYRWLCSQLGPRELNHSMGKLTFVWYTSI
jgi:hypothetical protein